MRAVRAKRSMVILHYAPITETIESEPLEIYPFLGSSRLAETIDRFQVSAIVHGHAHRGRYEGRTPGGQRKPPLKGKGAGRSEPRARVRRHARQIIRLGAWTRGVRNPGIVDGIGAAGSGRAGVRHLVGLRRRRNLARDVAARQRLATGKTGHGRDGIRNGKAGIRHEVSPSIG
jgi:hypothetical protein